MIKPLIVLLLFCCQHKEKMLWATDIKDFALFVQDTRMTQAVVLGKRGWRKNLTRSGCAHPATLNIGFCFICSLACWFLWRDALLTGTAATVKVPADLTKFRNPTDLRLEELVDRTSKHQHLPLVQQNASSSNKLNTSLLLDEKPGAKYVEAASGLQNSTAGIQDKRQTLLRMDQGRNVTIPHILIFTHKTNLLDPAKADRKAASRFLPNIVRTVQMYIDAWENDPRARVWFLDDEQCSTLLQRVHHSSWLHYFAAEVRGDFKADVCRAAALYLTGGYYFDVDIRPIQPVQFLMDNTTFSTAVILDDVSAFFQAFMAASPRNRIIHDSLSILLRYYAKQEDNKSLLRELRRQRIIKTAGRAVKSMTNLGLIGPFATEAAHEHVMNQESESKEQEATFLVEELMHTPERRVKFPDLEYQDDGVGCCCNYVVHNGKVPYFFSRMVGAGSYCEFANSSVINQTTPEVWWRQLFSGNVSFVQFNGISGIEPVPYPYRNTRF